MLARGYVSYDTLFWWLFYNIDDSGTQVNELDDTPTLRVLGKFVWTFWIIIE